jgi:hypothetical protein
MAKNEHVALLGRGAAAWHAWRAEHGEVPDLSRAALRGLDLSGFDSFSGGPSGRRSSGNKVRQYGSVGCPLGGGEPLQGDARRR